MDGADRDREHEVDLTQLQYSNAQLLFNELKRRKNSATHLAALLPPNNTRVRTLILYAGEAPCEGSRKYGLLRLHQHFVVGDSKDSIRTAITYLANVNGICVPITAVAVLGQRSIGPEQKIDVWREVGLYDPIQKPPYKETDPEIAVCIPLPR